MFFIDVEVSMVLSSLVVPGEVRELTLYSFVHYVM